MKKKILLFVIGLLAFLAVPSGSVFAAEEIQQGTVNKENRYLGEVVLLSKNSFTIMTSKDGEVVFSIDKSTHFVTLGFRRTNYEKLRIGSKVIVVAKQDDDGGLYAQKVVLLPDKFVPGKWMSVRKRGTVASIDTANDLITLDTVKDGEVSFKVTDETKIKGKAESLEQIEVGWIAVVLGEETENGDTVAHLILAIDHLRNRRIFGQVLDVNEEGKTFSLKTRNQKVLEIQVTDETMFQSMDGNVENFQDLDGDEFVMVIAEPKISGKLEAVAVFGLDVDEIRKFDLRLKGKIEQVADDSLSVTTKAGNEYTFVISNETQVFGISGQIKELSDLDVGEKIFVGVITQDDGSMLARLIFISQ